MVFFNVPNRLKILSENGATLENQSTRCLVVKVVHGRKQKKNNFEIKYQRCPQEGQKKKKKKLCFDGTHGDY